MSINSTSKLFEPSKWWQKGPDHELGSKSSALHVSVIGAGVFGVTTAILLAQDGHRVDLLESDRDILRAASGSNQFRLHRGYHYPRSPSTAESCRSSEVSFRKLYGPAICDDHSPYYAISARDSLTSPEDFIKFCDSLSLEYSVEDLDILEKDSIGLTVRVVESLYDPQVLKDLAWHHLNRHGVNVRLHTRARIEDLETYDLKVIATYASINELLEEGEKKTYQFEVCEKPVVKLPVDLSRTSVVILDGPFMCVDPLGDTGYSVLGNVVHAIHHANVGMMPEVPDVLEPLLNSGVVSRPPVSRIGEFLDSGAEFVPQLSDAQHVGSMFTIRAVLPDVEATDERPTLIESLSDDTIVVFSGKIGTCVEAAEAILRMVHA